MGTPRTARPLAAIALGVLAASALAACGGEEEAELSGTEAACREYRDAVTAVRFSASPADQASDFAAAAEAAAGAADAASEEELGDAFDDYAATAEELASAYEDAAAALEDGDDAAFNGALDLAEPADDALDGLARDAGLESCALGEVGPDQQGVSQSGFPAMAVPAAATPIPPTENTVSYGLGDLVGSLRLVRLDEIDTGTVAPAEAAELFEAQVGGEFASLEEVGESGSELVPMLEFAYEFETGGETVPGIAHVFSGQGHLFALDCSAAEAGEPPEQLIEACDAAVESLGFLIF